MFGLFGIFGRARELRRLDQALRAVDLHPYLVPEAVKLATVRLMKDATGGDQPPDGDYAPVAALLAYCMTGPEAFAEANGPAAAAAVESRIDTALEAGDSPDARLVLLTLHARVLQPGVVERFGLESEESREA